MSIKAELEKFRIAKYDEQRAEIARLQQLKTPATRQLLNITKAALDGAEAECAKLRAALAIARNWMPTLSEALNDTVRDEVRTVEAALANEQKE